MQYVYAKNKIIHRMTQSKVLLGNQKKFQSLQKWFGDYCKNWNSAYHIGAYCFDWTVPT